MSWRINAFNIAFKQHNRFTKEDIKNLDVYQFGVFSGGTMRQIAEQLNNYEYNISTFHGYDVFTGMPKETEEPIYQDTWNPDIHPDEFNAVKYLNLNTPQECADLIENQVQDIFNSGNNSGKASIYPGLVQETLPLHVDEYKPAFYVDFDLDIYSSTKFSFEFLAKNKLIVPGTFIGYDDWGGTPGYLEFKDGESRAHKEVTEKYGIVMSKLHEIGYGFPHIQNIWVVNEVK